MQKSLFEFTASVIPGSHRGTGMGTPTLNLNMTDVPSRMKEGIYACHAIINDQTYNAAMHYGPRPVHQDTPSCEVHMIDEVLDHAPVTVTVEVIAYMRPVMDFASEEALKAQIADDIAQARGILEGHGSSYA